MTTPTQETHYWLLKSEEGCYSIDDMKKDKKTAWTGIRNYQARNFMRDMKRGDLCLFYHSSCEVPAVVGIAKVVGETAVDETQFDKKDDHYDPKATKEKPIWLAAQVSFDEKLKKPVSLTEIKLVPTLKGIKLAEVGSRLSVMPISKTHFDEIVNRGRSK